MKRIKFYPLICVDRENGDFSPLIPTENKATVEAHHSVYLSEMIPHYYRLAARYPLPKNAWQDYNIHCPLCGKSMIRMSTPTDANHLPLYCCPDCSRK